MLKQQLHKPLFTGGLESAQLVRKPWVVDLLRESGTRRMFFAYDMPQKYEPLVEAGKLLQAGGFTRASHSCCCYCLIGYFPWDTPEKAEKRIRQAWVAGFFPYVMLYRGEDGAVDPVWETFYKGWQKPQIVASQLKEAGLSQKAQRGAHAAA